LARAHLAARLPDRRLTAAELSRRVLMEDWIDFEMERESEQVRVYAWRAEQLGKLGVSMLLADAVSNAVDWHEVAWLVEKGCPPELALDIARRQGPRRHGTHCGSRAYSFRARAAVGAWGAYRRRRRRRSAASRRPGQPPDTGRLQRRRAGRRCGRALE